MSSSEFRYVSADINHYHRNVNNKISKIEMPKTPNRRNPENAPMAASGEPRPRVVFDVACQYHFDKVLGNIQFLSNSDLPVTRVEGETAGNRTRSSTPDGREQSHRANCLSKVKPFSTQKLQKNGRKKSGRKILQRTQIIFLYSFDISS